MAKLKKSIDKKFLLNNVVTNYKILIVFLQLATVTEEEDNFSITEKPNDNPIRGLFTKNFSDLRKVWDMMERNHNEICGDPAEEDKEDSYFSDEEIRSINSEENEKKIVFDKLFSKSNIEVTIGQKRYRNELKREVKREEREEEKEVYKSDFILRDVLNNNKNIITCEVIYDMLVIMQGALDNGLVDLKDEESLKNKLGLKIKGFSTIELFSSVLKLTRKINRMNDFCNTNLDNPVFNKFKFLVSEELKELKNQIIDFQYTVINQFDERFDKNNYLKMQLDKKRPLTFFSLNKWILKNEFFYDILLNIVEEIYKTKTDRGFIRRLNLLS